MKTIDAQRWLAAAYTLGMSAPFTFKNPLLLSLKGRSLFQQAAQNLEFVQFQGKTNDCAGGWIWDESKGFPGPEMSEALLKEQNRLYLKAEAKKKNPPENGAAAQPPLAASGEDLPAQQDELAKYARYRKLIDETALLREEIRQIREEIRLDRKAMQGLYSSLGRIIANQVIFAEKSGISLKFESLRAAEHSD